MNQIHKTASIDREPQRLNPRSKNGRWEQIADERSHVGEMRVESCFNDLKMDKAGLDKFRFLSELAILLIVVSCVVYECMKIP